VRKLLCAACGYAGALLLAHYLLPLQLLVPAAGICAVLTGLSFLLRGKKRHAAVAILLAALVGFSWYYGYRRLFVMPAEGFVGETRTVTVRISDYPEIYDDYASVSARSVDETVPHVSMLIYDYSAGMSELRPGDIVEFPLKLLSAGEYYKEESDRYLAEGVQLRGYLKGEYQVSGRARMAWIYFPQKISRVLSETVLHCFPEDVAPLMKALLTGDRREYYMDDVLYTSMKSAGLSHVVAVSGMHVSFLIGTLNFLIRRRRRAALFGIPLVVVFMAMVGFTPSVVRAGVMQILLLAAPLLRRENDPPTSLAAAAMLLLLCNPIAIASISLQLSFAAMAGLLIFAPKVGEWLHLYDYRPKGMLGKLRRNLGLSFSASLGAIVFTTPISALYFGYVPLYTVLSNLLCLWAISLAFMLGYAVCVIGLFSAVAGMACGWLVSWLPRYVIFIVQQIAALPMAVIVTKYNIGAWFLVFVYAVFGAAWVFRGREAPRPVMPCCACVIALLLLSWFPQERLQGELNLTAIDVGQGQSLAVMSDNGTVIIDCGSTGTAVNAGDAAADYLCSVGRRKVDLLLLTHFHADHANGVKRLLNRVRVDRLAYPTDCEANRYMDEILTLCDARGIELIPVTENTDMTVDSMEFRIYAPLGSEDVNEHCLLIRGDYGDFEFLVTGDAGMGVERLLSKFYDLGDMEVFIVGHHGSKYSTSDTLLDDILPETAIISVGSNNSYGHPTDEVLERLERRNIDVYRTDLHGTVTITVGEDHG